MTTYNRGFRRFAILNMISAFGPISRTRLSDISGFRPATVGEVAKELLDDGLVAETGFSASGAGRRRTMLEVNRPAIGAVGIAIASDRVSAVLATLDGAIHREETCPRSPGADSCALAAAIGERVERLLKAARGITVVGIGIGEPPYDPAAYEKHVPFVANYDHFNDWVRLELKAALTDRFRLPVHTLSAVTLPALVERQFGAVRDARNILCIELSNGIGASIIAGGTPVSGANGVAGELGHTVVDLNDRQRCYCGKTGCAELGAAFPELVQALRQAMDRGAHTELTYDALTPEGLAEALARGEPLACHYVGQAARRAGTAIANAVNLLNPEVVVLYGYMLKLGEPYLEAVRSAIRENTLELARGFEICASLDLESKTPLGAAAEVFSRFMRREEFQWVYNMTGGEETP